MRTTLVGTTSNATATTGDRFRVTWQAAAADFFSPAHFDLRGYANDVLEWLPSQGFIPVSSNSTLAGSAVIVYDVKLGTMWGSGRTVADVVAALDKLPFLVDIALNVSRLEYLAPGTSSSQLNAGLQQTIAQGNQVAEDMAAEYDPFAWLSKLGTFATVTLVVAAVGVGVYLYRRA